MVLALTTDFSLLDLYLTSLSTSLMPSSGRDTAKALSLVEDFLKNEPASGTILFVTDGIEPRAFAPFRSFTSQEEEKDDILVMGVGTSHGGPALLDGNRFLTDRTGRRVFAKLDVDALRSLKSKNIAVTTLTLNDDDIEWIQRHVQHHLQAIPQRAHARWIDEGYLAHYSDRGRRRHVVP